MNREMMWYWGLVHESEDYWVSNNTARKDHAQPERRQMPPETGLTAAEARAVHHALGILPRDVAWDHRLQNYSEPLNVVCANWLDSCKAERCFKLAEQTKKRRVYCPSWHLTMQCLDLETNYTQPGMLSNTGNWTSRWSYLTDQLPGVTAPPPIIQPRWWFLALLAHIIIALLHFVKYEIEKYQAKHHKDKFKPERVQRMQCRFKQDYDIDAPGIVNANTSVLINRLTKGNQIINQSFNITIGVDTPHDHPWNSSIDQMMADLAKISSGGSISWLEFMAQGYYTDMVNDIWSKITEGHDSGLEEIEFGRPNLVERSSPQSLTAEDMSTAQLINATQAAGGLLLLGLAVVAVCCWHKRRRQAAVTLDRTDSVELGIVVKQADGWPARPSTTES